MYVVQVFGENELLEHIRLGGEVHDHLISIGNPRRALSHKEPGHFMPPLLRDRFRRYLRLSFSDIDTLGICWCRRSKARIASIRDIRSVIRFFRSTQREATGYTIHCWRGVSRSAAVALGILYMMTGSEKEAISVLRKVRPNALPLKRVVRLFDTELGSDLSAVNDMIFAEQIVEWKKKLHLELDAFLEELPAAIEEDHNGHEN